jgi:hypothetical protein
MAQNRSTQKTRHRARVERHKGKLLWAERPPVAGFVFHKADPPPE